MKFRTEIELDNDAFADYLATELGDILDRIAGQVREGYFGGPIHDSNGNTVGSWEVS